MVKVTDEKAYSIFDTRTTEEIHQEIQQVYLGDSRPWVLATAEVKTRRPRFSWCGTRSKSFRLNNAKSRFMSLRLTRWSRHPLSSITSPAR